jgi:IMP dehydrogenase
MQQGIGSRERYGQSDVDEEELVPQGIEGMVPYAGTVKSVMTQFTGGLRSALGYCGCRNLSELHKTAQFTRVSAASIREAHPHDVKIMKDAPNYRS